MIAKRWFVPALIAVTLLGVAPHAARAWNKPGHMTVAAIAYRELQRTNNQAVIDKVVGTLKQHPDFNRFFKAKLENVTPADRDLYLFMLAARWADDIRGKSPLDDGKAHFIDIPFVPADASGITGPPPDPHNVLSKMNEQLQTITTGADSGKDAIGLTWIMHLVGDIHQPLHAVSMYNADVPPPQGDRGGNAVFIKVEEDRATIKLHSFWDGLLGGSERFQSVRDRALGLIGRPDMARDKFPQLSQTDPQDWANESHHFAVKVAYLDGEIDGSGDRDDGQLLPDEYRSTAKGVAEGQGSLAGYRLADLLKKLAPSL